MANPVVVDPGYPPDYPPGAGSVTAPRAAATPPLTVPLTVEWNAAAPTAVSLVTATLTVVWAENGAFGPTASVPCQVPCDQVFETVDAAVVAVGGTRVTWTLVENFPDPGPFTATLQWSPAGGPDSDDWQACGPPARDPKYLYDPVQRAWGTWNLVRYRVVLVSDSGGVYTSNPVGTDGHLPKADLLWAREVARKERLRMTAVAAGVYGYLLQERRYGTLCSCVDPVTHEQSNSSCHVCFAPGTLVRTESGFKKIEEIVSGDRVLTVDGSYQKVIQTMSRHYTGKVYKTQTTSMTEPVIVTPDHPFRALTGSHIFNDAEQMKNHGFVVCSPYPCNVYMRRLLGALHRDSGVNYHIKSGTWRAKTQVNGVRGGGPTTLGYFKTKDEARRVVDEYRHAKFDLGHKLDWVKAKDLSERRWVDTTSPNVIRDVSQVSAPVKPAEGRTKVLPRQGATNFTVDHEFLWVVGMYIAEGSTSGRAVNFSLHRKETDYRDRLIRFFTSHGYHPKVRYPKVGLGMCVTVASTTLAEWFPKWLGYLAPNKRIPEELMYLPEDKTRALLRGIWDGDGTKKTNDIGQTSETLALQMIELLHRVGEQPLVYRMSDRPGRLPAWVVSWGETGENRQRRWKVEGRLLSFIKKHEEIDYTGPVYNLEVEGNNTYVVQNIVVHNCFGRQYVGGYHPPVPCWYADPTPEDLTKMVDREGGRGQVTDSVRRARVVADLPVVTNDLWVNHYSDERYRVERVTELAAVRDVPVVYGLVLHKLPRTDVAYKIPVARVAPPDPPGYTPPAPVTVTFS